MSNYLSEGNLTHYECERFREASRIVDIGHATIFEALRSGGCEPLSKFPLAVDVPT